MWDIQPLVGLGPLKFGMSRDDVARISELGPVTAADPVFDGSVNEFRTMDVPVCNYVDDVLAAVDTNWRVKGVTFDGLDVYTTDARTVLQALEKQNGGVKVGLGSALFVNIGVNVMGFFDAETREFFDLSSTLQDNRGVGIFRRGAFDLYLQEYVDFSFL